MAERFLIEHFRPIWNVVLDGFGNHDPGKGRTAMKRPRWDSSHAGKRVQNGYVTGCLFHCCFQHSLDKIR